METTPIVFIINMAAAAALLIWAVRLVRTGFERALGAQLRLWLRRSTSNRFAAAASGAATALLMQSSTAVAVLMAGFVSAGAIGSVAGLAIMLGADLGSAVVALVLNSRLALVTPLLLLAGVMIFLRSSARRIRQVGRILIGLSLIFISLDLIREASQPLTSLAGAETAMLYLAEDVISAFVIAALFAWLVHSSVAAVLLFATLAAQGLLPIEAAFAMVLGANLGGSMIAVVLTLKADSAVRRVVWCNLLLRGGGAAVMLFLLMTYDPPTFGLELDAGQQALLLHLAFNIMLLVISLPLVGPLMRVAKTLVADAPDGQAENGWRSALDPTVQDQPRRAFACAQRELVEMGHRIEIMLREAIGLFERYDDITVKKQRAELQNLAQMSLDIRTYLSRVRNHDATEDTGNRAFELSGIAVNLEAGADVIARKMVDLARLKDVENVHFSQDGWRELTDFHDVVLRNVQHGISVLMSEDVGLARELVEQKERVRDLEQSLQRKHLKRLRKGLAETFETSAIHLDLLRALKMLNTSFAMIAYPLLEDRGELLESRLASS
ncbi:Na/Pi cotransporter family protein [uncultured Roseovarius sp.]|uniref:Na/Pi cotransporter family protein n=1 Tax=uncultured Roseovarius sp. TaxID=293344 RepID=UPI00262ADC81|nr:Na/Pi cotransporter family protein [uncultured Roseovarius sp.]